MTLRDRLTISTGNLWRMKLRALLTISGVLIAIAAFVSMLSFGAGNQAYVEAEFNKLGLFSTMQVYPANKADTASMRKLDRAAIERLAAVPGVNLVYPYDALSVKISIGDSTLDSKAQALPSAAVQTKLFSNLLAGNAFESDSSHRVMVSKELLGKFGIISADSALGLKVILAVRVSTIDSGLAHIIEERGTTIIERVKRISLDSLRHRAYRSRVIHTEANEVFRRFINGFTNAQQTIRDTLTICGVRDGGRSGRTRTEPLIIPMSTAARFSTTGFGGNPVDLYSRMSTGTIFSSSSDEDGKSFSQVTIDFDPKVPYKSLADSVEKMGFRTFSFAQQFEELQKFFFYFDLGLGVVGLIALLTASLGIVNTMVMSINERKREIGVLKSLGADDSDIRGLFLVESGVIGMIGTLGGIAFGWLITRGVSAVAHAYMRKEGIPEMELFALPLWLILIALAVGIGVSVLAGVYPAARAARVDPVAALRND